jgi:hypothetical protein
MFNSSEERVMEYMHDRHQYLSREDTLIGIAAGFLTVLVLAAPAAARPEESNGNHRCGGNRGGGQGNICIVTPDIERRSLPSAPGPLPIAGAGVALGFARQIRKRIQK